MYTEPCLADDIDQWQHARRLRGLVAFAAVAPLGTFAGCAAVIVGLSPVATPALLAAWYSAGLLMVVVQVLMWRALDKGQRTQPPHRDERRCRCRCWFIVGSLSTGLFWCAASFMLFPEDSLFHQILLACVVAAVTALWLPVFALERIALATVAAPALLPMAFDLLISPSAPLTAVGSFLLFLFIALLAIGFVFKRVLDADQATQQALYHRATHDSLVGLVNHAEFHRRVQALDCAPHGPYAVVFIDLDHFKEVNDTVGHAEGDRVLQDVGTIVRQEMRKADTGARIGGDEFAVLMQWCTDQEALRVAVSILERIDKLWDSGVKVTASIGIACSSEIGASTRSVLEAADQACYAAKRAGRNRIEIATTRNVGGSVERRGSARPEVPVPSQVIRWIDEPRSGNGTQRSAGKSSAMGVASY